MMRYVTEWKMEKVDLPFPNLLSKNLHSMKYSTILDFLHDSLLLLQSLSLLKPCASQIDYLSYKYCEAHTQHLTHPLTQICHNWLFFSNKLECAITCLKISQSEMASPLSRQNLWIEKGVTTDYTCRRLGKTLIIRAAIEVDVMFFSKQCKKLFSNTCCPQLHCLLNHPGSPSSFLQVIPLLTP